MPSNPKDKMNKASKISIKLKPLLKYFLENISHMAGDLRCVSGAQKVNQPIVQGYTSNNLPNFLKNNRIVHDTDILVIERCVVLNQINQPAKIAIFIAATNQKDFAGRVVNGLYEKIITDKIVKTLEVIPHVEAMHIRYGIWDQTYENIANYLTAPQISVLNWKNIGSIHIELSFVSIANVFSRSQSDHDQRLQHRWNIYIALRQNGFGL